MSSARYAPLPNPRSAHDADREMDDAFDDDGTEHGETTPLTINVPPLHSARESSAPGIYDFERDYDYPPPGSPPGPSTTALPNSIGNSNGLIPSSPIPRPLQGPRSSFFRRTVGALLPSYYQRVPAQPQAPGHGSGIGNDGVFANVMAKPQRARQVQTDDGEIYMVPEDTQAEAPPVRPARFIVRFPLTHAHARPQSYAAASADSAPPYWETTVHAPPPLNLNGDMIIDEMPTGPFVTFVFTTLISWFFQFPGFLLTYLLHGTHAGRFGSQAGLALTLIQFGFSATVTRGLGDDGTGSGNIDILPGGGEVPEILPSEPDMDVDAGVGAADAMYAPGREWISFLLMTIGA
jgi:hypothetical protein